MLINCTKPETAAVTAMQVTSDVFLNPIKAKLGCFLRCAITQKKKNLTDIALHGDTSNASSCPQLVHVTLLYCNRQSLGKCKANSKAKAASAANRGKLPVVN